MTDKPLARVLEAIAPAVHRFGLRMCRHDADADDVVQHTLFAVTEHLGEFAGLAHELGVRARPVGMRRAAPRASTPLPANVQAHVVRAVRALIGP